MSTEYRPDRYFLTDPGQPEREVSKQDYCYAERASGFCLGHGPDDITKPATAAFTGPSGAKGRIDYGTGRRIVVDQEAVEYVNRQWRETFAHLIAPEGEQ